MFHSRWSAPNCGRNRRRRRWSAQIIISLIQLVLTIVNFIRNM